MKWINLLIIFSLFVNGGRGGVGWGWVVKNALEQIFVGNFMKWINPLKTLIP